MFLPWLLSSDHFLRKTFEGSPRGKNGSARILQLPLNAAPNSTFDVLLACRLAACLVRSACDYGTNVFYNISQQFRAHENIRQWGQKELCWHITVPNCSQVRIVALIWHRLLYRCVPRHQSSAYIVPPTGFKPTPVQPIAVTATWLHNSRVVRILWGAWETKIELIVFKMLFNISLSHAQDCLPWYIAIAWLQTVVQWRVVSGNAISQVVYEFVLGLTMDAAEDEKCLSPSVSRREAREQTLSWNLLVCCQHVPCLLAATNINLEWTLQWSKPMGRNHRLFSPLFDFAPANKFCPYRRKLSLLWDVSAVRSVPTFQLAFWGLLNCFLPTTWHWSHPWNRQGRKICMEFVDFFWHLRT